MSHSFNRVPEVKIPRSSFNRSHGHKTTFDSGYLVPVYVDEVLPGDTFNLSASFFARMTTPLFPLMDNLFLDSFFFFVPNRLVDANFKKMMGEQDNPADSISFTVPQITSPSGGWTANSLGDYMGLPTAGNATGGVLTGNTVNSCAYFTRAYNKIWNDWFRDENLQNSVTVDTGAGPDSASNYVLLRRGKRFDYFTSCLPNPQKGSAAVTIPLGTKAPVTADSANSGFLDYYNSTLAGYKHIETDGTYAIVTTTAGTAATALYADLSSATAATVNQLRQSFQIQKLLERDARGGTRYTEIVRSHFGVISPDARLQRAELLGQSSQPIVTHTVPQTSATGVSGGSTAMGSLAAFATSAGRSGFVKSFTEHGVILGLVSVRADLSYQQGLNRMFSRSTRYDFYWPSFAHLGEQSVLNQEIYCDGSGAGGNDGGVFGYQERHAEYRYKPSLITGQFRSTYATPLDGWHLAQKFASLPTLNSTFIQDTPPLSRVLAVSATGSQFYFDSYIKLVCARPMPVYGIPGMIDRF